MKNLKNKLTLFVATLVAIGCLAGCTKTETLPQSSQQTTPPVASLAAPATNVASTAKAEDTSAVWDSESATNITLSDNAIVANGNGASVKENTVTISAEGTYVISGEISNGQILVNAPDTQTVQIILNGASITNKTGAPIYATSADKLIITLAEGTSNTLTDGGANFVYSDMVEEEPNAALFAKCDLTINGTGALAINAGFNNGIGTKDDLIITSGSYTVTAKNHGIRGRDSVTVLGGDFSITAGNDGIQTSNTEDTTKGWILIENGNFVISAGHDAIQAESAINILDGSFDITAGGGQESTTQITVSDTTSDSFKGIKAVADIAIAGGTFTINSLDDSIHANGNITITGGKYTIKSADDGIHADGDLTVSGGNIEILTSYEGLEANTMTIADGVITLMATDDGINISGGNDTSGGQRFGQDSFSASSDRWLKITGGTITVTAGRDGIDINGGGEMTGGDVNVTAATLGEGQTIDSDGTFNRAGGNLTESGGSSMGGPGGMGGAGGRGGNRPPQN